MNLKERGFTVGDLLIILVVIIFTTFIVKKYKSDNDISLNLEKGNTLFLINKC